MASITIKTDEQIKKEFNAICEELGLNMSVAINIFMKAVLREHGFPFELKLKEPNETTLKVIDEAERKENMNSPYKTVQELVEDLKK